MYNLGLQAPIVGDIAMINTFNLEEIIERPIFGIPMITMYI